MAKSDPQQDLPYRSLLLRATGRPNLLIVFGLVVLIAAAYWQVHTFELIDYDDDRIVARNVHVQGGLTVQGIKWALATDYQCIRMPMVWLSLMLDREIADLALAYGVGLGPDNAGVFHLTNVVQHAAGTLLLFLLLIRVTGCSYRSGVVAALFAIHPLHVESVAWVTERKDVLSGLFCMLTLLCYVAYARKPGVARYLLVALMFAVGLLTKPMLVTLPVLMLLLDFWPLRRWQVTPDTQHTTPGVQRPAADSRSLARLVLEKTPLLALALIAAVFACLAQQKSGAVGSLEVFPLGERVANGLTSYLVYAWQMFWPRGLVPFYPFPGGQVPFLPAAAGAVWLAIAGAYAIRTARRRPYVLFGWSWYVVSLLPVIGIIQVGSQAHADRYTYLPLVGLSVAVVWLVADVVGEQVRSAGPRLAGAVVLCLMICVLTALCHAQVGKWRDTFTLFAYTLRQSPHNPVAYNTLGGEMIRRGSPGKAERLLRKALEIWPDYATARNNLGTALAQMGRLDEAIKCFETALKGARPEQLGTIEMSLGLALVKKRRYGEALAHVRAGLAAGPDALGAHNNVGYVLALLGKDAEAESEYRKELRLNPRGFDAHLNLGKLLAEHRRYGEAIDRLNQAARISPSSLACRMELARALVGAGRTHEAARQHRKAATLANSQAWRLTTSAHSAARNGDEAVSLAVSACRMTGYRDPSALDTLAAAYAEAGRFDDAVATARKAAAMAESIRLSDLADQIRARLALYRARRPYRELRRSP